MKALVLFLSVIVIRSACATTPTIPMESVESSFIESVGYDVETQTMVVKMANSLDVYTYENVPQSVYDDFMAADSKGRFYVENIKGQYGGE